MFKSNDYKEPTGSNKAKILNPGVHYVRVVGASLDKPSYAPEGEKIYFVNLILEGIPEGNDFEGIPINKLDPSLGNYKGKIATVSSKRYPFSDYEYNGKPISGDTQIFNWLNSFASQWGVLEEMNKKDVSGDTIEEYFEKVKGFLINPEIWGHVTIGGKEYYKDGYEYPNYNLFFPNIDYKTKKYPFAASSDMEETAPSFLTFSEEQHIIKATKPEQNPALSEDLDSFEEDTMAQDANSFLEDMDM